MTITDGTKIPSEWLEALAVRVKLRRAEWRVVAIVLSSSSPISASTVAKRLRLDYGLVKRIGRELVLWNILERTPGLTFQPDHTRWGPPRPQQRDGITGRLGTLRSSARAGSNNLPREAD